MPEDETLPSRYIRMLEEYIKLLKTSGINAHSPQEAHQPAISEVMHPANANKSAVNSPSVVDAEEGEEDGAESSPIENPDSLPNQDSISTRAEADESTEAPLQSPVSGRNEEQHGDIPAQAVQDEEEEEGEEDVAPANETGKTEVVDTEENPIRVVINRWNEERSTWEDVDDSIVSKEHKKISAKPATFRRHMDPDNDKKVAFEEVEIVSQPLKELFAETDERWREFVAESAQPLVQQTPFYNFAWSWDEYLKACEPQEPDGPDRKASRRHLKALLEHIRMSRALESYLRLRDTMLAGKKIRHEYLWTLFSHGSRVYARSYMNELQMFEVKSTSSPPYSGRRFRVSCVCFDWDGSKFSRFTYDFFIKAYAGEKPINSLEVFPTKYYANEEGVYDDTQLRLNLAERGKKYYEICVKQQDTFQYRYRGTAIVAASEAPGFASSRHGLTALSSNYDPDQDGDEMDVISMDLTGDQTKVIIDNYSFLKSRRNTANTDDMPPLGKKISFVEPSCPCPVCKTSPLQQWRTEVRGYEAIRENENTFAEDEVRLLFLPPRLLGFVLMEKSWAQFLVNDITMMSYTDSEEKMKPFWQELQLGQDSKNQLMALVQFHKSSLQRQSGSATGTKDTRDLDIIEGKGQGLAILLHGTPGVGKTLTAETIAIATGRPLLNVSVAEIGLDAEEAERRLSDTFNDAARWDAVLLMDEADVFIEMRGPADLGRNALVSVLLRCLEYYEGIIILTTNRIKSIDIAVQSRIHLAIQYHQLSRQQRVQIYLNRIKWIPDDEIEDRKALEEGLTDSVLTSRSEANGRQIRNILIGARALAKSRKQQLRLKHLEEVDQTTSDFIKSMSSMMEKHRAKWEADSDRK